MTVPTLTSARAISRSLLRGRGVIDTSSVKAHPQTPGTSPRGGNPAQSGDRVGQPVVGRGAVYVIGSDRLRTVERWPCGRR